MRIMIAIGMESAVEADGDASTASRKRHFPADKRPWIALKRAFGCRPVRESDDAKSERGRREARACIGLDYVNACTSLGDRSAAVPLATLYREALLLSTASVSLGGAEVTTSDLAAKDAIFRLLYGDPVPESVGHLLASLVRRQPELPGVDLTRALTDELLERILHAAASDWCRPVQTMAVCRRWNGVHARSLERAGRPPRELLYAHVLATVLLNLTGAVVHLGRIPAMTLRRRSAFETLFVCHSGDTRLWRKDYDDLVRWLRRKHFKLSPRIELRLTDWKVGSLAVLLNAMPLALTRVLFRPCPVLLDLLLDCTKDGLFYAQQLESTEPRQLVMSSLDGWLATLDAGDAGAVLRAAQSFMMRFYRW